MAFATNKSERMMAFATNKSCIPHGSSHRETAFVHEPMKIYAYPGDDTRTDLDAVALESDVLAALLTLG